MRIPALAVVALLALTTAQLPAVAKVLPEGRPSPGSFYWQKV